MGSGTDREDSGLAVNVRTDIPELVREMNSGSVRALSRLMTLVEQEPNCVPCVMSLVYGSRKRAIRVGIAGPPGAGKSSLLSNLIMESEKRGLFAGALCIDPTSPLTGGALLGDRIRLPGQSGLKKSFIRSVASGKSLGGVAQATKHHTILLEAFGADIIIIETVGLGQVGYDIRNIAHTLLLALVPESGDTVQILKSGILELADVMVVNKSDRDGADEIAATLRNTFDHPKDDGWNIPVLKTCARDNIGTDDVWDAIMRHHEHIKSSGKVDDFFNPMSDLVESLEARFSRMVSGGMLKRDKETNQILNHAAAGEVDPYSAADEILKILFKGDPHGQETNR